MSSPLLKRVAGVIAILAALVVLGSLMFEWFFNRMTFYPELGISFDPARIQRPVDQVFIETDDGVRIHAFYLPAGGERALIFFHGNASNASQRLPTAARFAELGVDVLLVSYRGYGRSEGKPSEEGIYRDAAAAHRYLGERGFADSDIFIFGRSLGGVVALDLARDHRFAGLILCATFTNARDMASVVGLGWAGRPVARRLDALARIRDIESPFLQFHGDADEIVPLALGRKLHAAAPPGLGRLIVIPGARHNDLLIVAGDDFWSPVAEFLGRGEE